VRIEELAHYREQVVERQQKRLAQRHRDGLLRRRQRRLQAVRRVAAVVNVVAVLAWIAARIFGVVVACLCREISMSPPPPEPRAGSTLP